jgi:hypothetical protein
MSDMYVPSHDQRFRRTGRVFEHKIETYGADGQIDRCHNQENPLDSSTSFPDGPYTQCKNNCVKISRFPNTERILNPLSETTITKETTTTPYTLTWCELRSHSGDEAHWHSQYLFVDMPGVHEHKRISMTYGSLT